MTLTAPNGCGHANQVTTNMCSSYTNGNELAYLKQAEINVCRLIILNLFFAIVQQHSTLLLILVHLIYKDKTYMDPLNIRRLLRIN